MNKRVFFIIVLLCGSFLNTAWADENYVFDKEHSSIRFSVDNFEIFDITGAFTEFDGSFMFCLPHPEKDKVSMTLYAAGLHTADADRDEELQGPHFFDAAHYPRITFISTSVKHIDADNADVTGNLTLRGMTKPVTFHVHFNAKDVDDDDGDVRSFTASATIQRSDFGMDYLSHFAVGNDVQLKVEATGVETGATQPSGKQP